MKMRFVLLLGLMALLLAENLKRASVTPPWVEDTRSVAEWCSNPVRKSGHPLSRV